MKIEIGRTIEANGGKAKLVQLDLAKLTDSRLLITASSGGGKSWALRLLAEAAAGAMQTVILDPEGEFASLREKFDFLLVSKDGEIKPEPRAAALLARKLAELRVNAVIDLFDLHVDQRRAFVRDFLVSLVNIPRALWHPMLVMLDEAHKFCPEGKDTDSSGAVIDLMSQGRKRGMCGVLATQRLSKLNKDAAAEANNNLIGRTILDNDQKRAADILGLAKSDWPRLRDLPDGGWFGFGPAFTDKGVINFRTGDVQTTHPKAGQRHKLTPPKASEAVKQIAAQLADLPQAAEAEIRSLDDAKRRIRDLEREARQKPVVEKPVETVKRVEIPVVGIRQIQRLESAVAAMAALHESLNGHCKKIEDSYAGVGLRAKEIQEALAKARREGEKPADRLPPDIKLPGATARFVTPKHVRIMPTAQPKPTFGSGESDPGVSKKGGLRRMLIALAQCPKGLTGIQLAVRSRVAIGTSTFRIYLKKIKDNGWAVGDSIIQVTQAGINALGSYEPLPVGAELRRHWLADLRGGIGRMLESLIKTFPLSMTRQELADASQIPVDSSTFRIYFKKLRDLELAIGKEDIRASEELFDAEELEAAR